MEGVVASGLSSKWAAPDERFARVVRGVAAVGQNLNDAAADDRDAIEACRLISPSGVAAPRWRHPDRRGNRCVAWH
jgi:hypothetical protein